MKPPSRIARAISALLSGFLRRSPGGAACGRAGGELDVLLLELVLEFPDLAPCRS